MLKLCSSFSLGEVVVLSLSLLGLAQARKKTHQCCYHLSSLTHLGIRSLWWCIDHSNRNCYPLDLEHLHENNMFLKNSRILQTPSADLFQLQSPCWGGHGSCRQGHHTIAPDCHLQNHHQTHLHLSFFHQEVEFLNPPFFKSSARSSCGLLQHCPLVVKSQFS